MTDGSKRDARVSSVAVDSQVLTVVEGTARSHRAASCLRQGVGASRLPLPTYWHQERASSKSTPWPRPTTRSDGDRGRPACDLLGFDVHHSPEFEKLGGRYADARSEPLLQGFVEHGDPGRRNPASRLAHQRLGGRRRASTRERNQRAFMNQPFRPVNANRWACGGGLSRRRRHRSRRHGRSRQVIVFAANARAKASRYLA
jgi:hypothetical protein